MKTFFYSLITLLFLGIDAQAQFTQDPLPYEYNALEPFIDAQTMEIHYSKHHAAYVKNLNNALKEAGLDGENDILKIMKNISKYNTAIRNNAGGYYNHSLYWKFLTPDQNTKPSEILLKAITETFGDLDKFKTEFNKAALGQFGSGWAWLIVTPDKKLVITSTANQDNPLMDIAPVKGIPLLTVDVWEHAYYLKYQNRRGDYLQAIWNIINWNEVNKLYNNALSE
jgi:Fe-Mn family superoxide dismutase